MLYETLSVIILRWNIHRVVNPSFLLFLLFSGLTKSNVNYELL